MRKCVTLFPALAFQVRRIVTFEVRLRHSQKLKELERRRRRGARLLASGESQAGVARKVGVSRQTGMRWERARQEGGMEALRRATLVQAFWKRVDLF